MADGRSTPRFAYSQGTRNGLLGRSDGWRYVLEEPGEPGPRRRRTPPAQVRVVGLVRLVEGQLPFDVTVLPGETVTLDLADLAAKANRGR